jgi:hypothetical protein
MTGRRRRLLLGAGVLAAAGLLGAYAMVPPEPGVTPANCCRLRVGMKEQDVEAILGRPGRLGLQIGPVYQKVWQAGPVTVRIVFDWEDDDRVLRGRWSVRGNASDILTEEEAAEEDGNILHHLGRLVPW